MTLLDRIAEAIWKHERPSGWTGVEFTDLSYGRRDDLRRDARAAWIVVVQDLIRALRAEGMDPAHRRDLLHLHRGEWPALWEAIDAIVDVPPPIPQEPDLFPGPSAAARGEGP